jgi:hypothetical protein
MDVSYKIERCVSFFARSLFSRSTLNRPYDETIFIDRITRTLCMQTDWLIMIDQWNCKSDSSFQK